MVYTYYRATLNARVWKERTCAACGCVYRTAADVSASDTGGLEVIARERAAQALAKKARDSREASACPGCGRYPADAIARTRFNLHTVVALVAAALFIGLAVVAGLKVLPEDTLLPAIGGAAALTLVGHALAWRYNPNESPEKNLPRAEEAVNGGRAVVVTPAREVAEAPPARRYPVGAFFAAALTLTAPAAAAFLAVTPKPPPVQVSDAGADVPEIVKPGGTCFVRFPAKGFKSVNGLVMGSGLSLEVTNAAAVGAPPTLKVSMLNEPWDKTIRTEMNSTDFSPDLRIRVQVPDDPKLEGKELRCHFAMDAYYPYRTGQSSYLQKYAKVHHDFKFRVARADQASARDRFFMAVTAAGFSVLLALLGGACLAAASRGRTDPEAVRLIGLEG